MEAARFSTRRRILAIPLRMTEHRSVRVVRGRRAARGTGFVAFFSEKGRPFSEKKATSKDHRSHVSAIGRSRTGGSTPPGFVMETLHDCIAH